MLLHLWLGGASGWEEMLHQPKGWISNLLSSHVACLRESYDHPEKASQVSRSSGPRQGDRESNLKNSSYVIGRDAAIAL